MKPLDLKPLEQAIRQLPPLQKPQPKRQQNLPPANIAALIGDEHLINIIRCESGFKQFDVNGNPLMSKTRDVGISQINVVWWAEAKARGLDIFNSIEDNIAMGKIILAIQGYGAWTCNSLI